VLIDKGIVGQEFNKTKDRFKRYLSGEKTVDYSGHTLLWDTQQEFHKKNDEVHNFCLSYFNQYDDDLDVVVAQQEFITEMGVDTKVVPLSKNIFEYCYKKEDLVSKEKKYELVIRENYDNEDDYMKMFYFKRRQGWGKYRIENL